MLVVARRSDLPHRMLGLGGILPPSPPAEKANARQDDAGQSRTNDWPRNSKRRIIPRREADVEDRVRRDAEARPVEGQLVRPEISRRRPGSAKAGEAAACRSLRAANEVRPAQALGCAIRCCCALVDLEVVANPAADAARVYGCRGRRKGVGQRQRESRDGYAGIVDDAESASVLIRLDRLSRQVADAVGIDLEPGRDCAQIERIGAAVAQRPARAAHNRATTGVRVLVKSYDISRVCFRHRDSRDRQHREHGSG